MTPTYRDLLASLYGEDRADDLAHRVQFLANAYGDQVPANVRQRPDVPWTERDAVLITYADQVQAPGEAPLQTLAGFLTRHAADWISAVHILPFYPSSSDDGFAVMDFLAVDPAFGSWDDLARLGARFELMFDAVFNHLSSRSAWFERFLAGDPAFGDFFVTVDGHPDLSAVVRPRALPLLTEFEGEGGRKKVWTTFSADQVDLNVRNPEVVLALLEVLLFYVSCGARFIRLDAIAYLWKEIGTPCIHLPQTHRIIQLMRRLLDEVAPRVALITETNVPHQDNLSYFGDGLNEAQMVYNFALPPLVVHTFRTGDATALSRWAAGLALPSDKVTFFNFLASHDGIGLNPVRGILPPDQIDALVAGTLRRGGLISYKQNPDGTRSPYEMNINYLDALADPDRAEDDEALSRRLLTAHAMMFALPGVPAVYFHSLVGSRGDATAATRTGMPRRINREKLHRDPLEAALAHPDSLRARVFAGLRNLLHARRRSPAFSPRAHCEILDLGPGLFAVRRTPAQGRAVLGLHHARAETTTVTLPEAPGEVLAALGASVSGREARLGPHATLWCDATPVS